MDIPDIEELELLESHAYDEEFDLEPEFELEPNPPSSPEPEIKDAPKRVPLVLPSTLSKRLLSDPIPSHAKRIRRNEDLEDDVEIERMEIHSEKADDNGETNFRHESSDADEEWLRYSPASRIEENVAPEKENEEIILSRYATEIDGDFVPVTGLDGERVYAKKCQVETMENFDEGRRKLGVVGDNGLLEEPVRVLMQKVEHEEFEKALQDSVEGPTEIVTLKAPVTSEKLWVDKYAPSSFTELLSDEQTNREVLLWLKQWDSCVFGSEIKSTADDVLSALRRHSSGSHHSKQSTRNNYSNNSQIRFSSHTLRTCNTLDADSNITTKTTEEIFDKRHKVHGPPEQKVLLLCGPPGLGKTTLAHVAARHCGYRVVEINASDDRSSATIEAKILDVVQMNSVVADSKPKCLVIDEIDGALGEGKGAVEVILQLVSADKKGDIGKENMHKEMHSGRKNSQKKHKNSLLIRPVICICNDLYAPALRPLRHVAKVYIFSQPTVSRVVNRLKHICKREGVKTSSIALTALAEYTECDIRSCLNTLQFLNKKKETLNVLEISSQVVGRKDASKSAFDIWKEIFQKKKGKQARKKSSSNISNDFEFLYTMISNRGDYDFIMEGIHENILQLRYVDPVLSKTVQCLDNLVVSDITNRYIMHTQKMILQVYQPAIAISIRGVVAQVEKVDIQWPKSFQRCRTISKERVDTFQSWHHRVLPNISRHLSPKSFVEDSISQLLHIMSPSTLRPVALHLLSESEKENLGQLIDTMVSYAVTYKNVKHVDDSLDASTLDFYPPIGDFIRFKGYESCHVDLSLALKQVLVHEVEKKKILQNSSSKSIDLDPKANRTLAKNVTESGPSSKSSFTNGSAEAKTIAKRPAVSESRVSASATDESKSVKRTKKASTGITSFFDRFKKVVDESSGTTNNAKQRPGKPRRDSHTLLFKFNEVGSKHFYVIDCVLMSVMTKIVYTFFLNQRR